MAYSKVDIVNLALATLGADSIRSFADQNKRARMGEVFYDYTRSYLLNKFDWSFARSFATLAAIDSDALGIEVPEGQYAYALPSDCLVVRCMHPKSKRISWEIFGKYLYTPKDSNVQIYYTRLETSSQMYSEAFSNVLALGIAVRMSPSITQDKQLTNALFSQYKTEVYDAWESDANIGNTYRAKGNDPDNDAFVDPSLSPSALTNTRFSVEPAE